MTSLASRKIKYKMCKGNATKTNSGVEVKQLQPGVYYLVWTEASLVETVFCRDVVDWMQRYTYTCHY